MTKALLRYFGKNDLFLLTAVAIIIIAVFVFRGYADLSDKAYVKITVKNQTYGVYSLDEDKTIEIYADAEVINTVKIEDGTVKMLSATCPDKLCVKQGKISKGGSIVCLPHQVVVSIVDDDSEIDSMTR